jgi:hypothetical protein
MKRTVITLLLLVAGLQFSVAQQIINTTIKSTCTYQASSSSLTGCSDQSQTVILTFRENQKIFTHNINGVEMSYAIESRTYEAPFFTYRVNNGEGLMYDLKVNQSTQQCYFYPVTLTDGAEVNWYH